MAFDLSGRIILQDAFSWVMNRLQTQTRSAEDALEHMGQQTDTALQPAKARIAELTREVERLQLRAKSGARITLADVAQFQGASAELRGLQGNMDAMTNKTRQGASAMELFGKVALVAGTAFGVLRTADAVLGIARVGAAAQTQAGILQSLGQANQVNTRALVAGLREAGRGTLDTATIMTTANRALLAGGGRLATELPRLFAIARAASLATGSDINYVYETLIKGIIRASPLLIDNADIYIKVGQAVDAYAASVDKTTDNLTAQERQTAVLNAVLQQGGAFIKQMGLDSETAADQMQSLPVALSDVKLALGELLVQAGAARAMGGLAAFISGGTGERNLRVQATEIQTALKALDAAPAAEAMRQELKALTAETNRQILSGHSMVEAQKDWAKAADEVITRYAALREQVAQAGIPEPVRAVQAIQASLEASSAAAAAATEKLKTYNEALKGVIDKATGLTALTGQLGELAGLLQVAQVGVPPPPQVSTLLDTNVAALREYLDGIAKINPAVAPVIAEAARSVDVFGAQQQAVLASARAMSDHAAALDMIARATLGAGATVGDLVSKFDTLSPPVQQAVLDLGLLENALGRVQSQAAKPISIDVMVNGLNSALADIDRLALRLTGVLAPDQIRAFRDQARAEVSAHWQTMTGLDSFGMELEKGVILKGYDDIVAGTLEHYRTLENATRQHYTNLADSAAGLKSQIESALKSGLEVTPEQMLAAQTGTYRDVALESARRLQAIAERGFAEIQAHPDWAAALKIPAEVLSGSEASLKAWAARMKGEVTDLARPDLINWDAFIGQFRQQLDREAAKKLTIDIAVEKLEATGLLKGMSEQERKKKVAQMLGLTAPKLTIEALFETQVGAQKKLVSDLLEGKSALEVPAVLQLATGTELEIENAIDTATKGVQPVEAPPVGAGLPGPGLADWLLGGKAPAVQPSTVTFDWAQTTQDAAAGFSSAFEQALQTQDIALQTVTALSNDFSKNYAAWRTVGAGAGQEIGDAFQLAVIDGVGEIRMKLAEVLAPEVAAILARKSAGSGAKP